jgi:anti-sigma B factor antagonist
MSHGQGEGYVPVGTEVVVGLPILTRRTPDGTVCVVVSGEIDLNTAHLVRDAVTTVLAKDRPTRIVVDLAAVSLVDSFGSDVLVSCFHAAAACGVPLVAAGVRPLVHRQLWLCGVARLFGLPARLPPPQGESGIAVVTSRRRAYARPAAATGVGSRRLPACRPVVAADGVGHGTVRSAPRP